MTVVRFLNKIFSDFDHIAEELGVEKIKTIGDCYMAITGAPVPSEGSKTNLDEDFVVFFFFKKKKKKKKGIMLRL